MSLATLQIFNQYAYQTMVESIAQNIALFNANTRGGLTLTSAQNQGSFSDKTLYQRLSGLVRRRNVFGSGALTQAQLTMLLDTSVKVGAGTPPVRIDPAWWKWILRSPDEAGVVLGMQLAEETIKDMVNLAIKGLVAAMVNDGTNVSDGTGANLSLGALNTGASKFGDRAQALQAWLIHSKPMFDLYGTALAGASFLYRFGDVAIKEDGFGRIFVITDAPDLAYTSSGQKYRTIGLVPGAAIVEQNNDYTENVHTINGNENIERTWQAEWTYNVGFKGFSWDKSNGGSSPNDAAIATGPNWDRYATSAKDLPGVLVDSQ